MTRLSDDLLLQAVEDDLVLVDGSGQEIRIPNSAIGRLAEAAAYFRRQLVRTDEPTPPYGPGAICEECGHFAGRHGVAGCEFPAESRSGEDRGTPCGCSGLLWLGHRWSIVAGAPVLIAEADGQ